MDAGKKKRIIIMVASWLVIIGVIGLVYKFVVEPWIRGDLVKETSTQR